MTSKIEYVSIDTLIPYARNARTHSDVQVAQIAASITEFGWTNPILVDGAKGVIAGHGRLLAARKLGHDEVPVIELSHLTDTQKRAYIIADNKLSLNAGWDDEVLSVEMEELDDKGFDLTLTGFDDDEVIELQDIETENTQEENIENSLVPEDLTNKAWARWAGEVKEQIETLRTCGNKFNTIDSGEAPFMGITIGYATNCFLKAKYNGAEYPRHCSLAFHPHQVLSAGNSLSLIDGLNLVAEGKIKQKNHPAHSLRFVLQEKMDVKSLSTCGIPFNGAKFAKDFPVSLARDLYDEFAINGKVLDPCHGWGGRLTGFLLSKANSYTGIDVSKAASVGVKTIQNTYQELCEGKKVDLHCSKFEDFEDENNIYDFALTSPPYFDVEKYEGDEQPHIIYDNYTEWKQGFYAELIEKTYSLLKKGGVFALQVGSQRYPLLDDGKNIALQTGFKFIEVRDAAMQNSLRNTEEEKAEVILILKK